VIADVDEVLRKLMIKEIDIKANEIDVSFDLPKREWSSRLSKPTLNFFLFDVRENLRLRMAEQYSTINRPDGIAEVRRNPVRMDLRYLLTAWVKDPADEHMLLSSALTGLLRNPFLPVNLLSENLKTQSVPMPIEVANFPPEIGPVDKFTELWGVLDNEMHAGILVTVTISIDPYKPMLFPIVHTREARVIQDTGFAHPSNDLPTKSLDKTYWSIGGTLKSDKYDVSTLAVVLAETHTTLPLDAEGRFMLHNIMEGEYHLDIMFNQKVLKHQNIVVPSPGYDIQV